MQSKGQSLGHYVEFNIYKKWYVSLQFLHSVHNTNQPLDSILVGYKLPVYKV